eukprot:COSAG05_NODE_1868_length_3927_cov_18.028316_2_plen_80_part_00
MIQKNSTSPYRSLTPVVDYSDWFHGPQSKVFSGSLGAEPNAVGRGEDRVEMRRCCDGYACMHGQWNDMGDVPQPFLRQL